jgi:1-acyl-sn-glycerol-3-phosphate acyltransferase
MVSGEHAARVPMASAARPALGGALSEPWWLRLFRPAARLGLRMLMRVAFRLEVVNSGAIPVTGPFVLVANHASHADAPALLASLPTTRRQDTHPLAAKDYFFATRTAALGVRLLLNAFPVDRRSSAAEAMAPALGLLRQGRGVIVFPEGTRSNDGTIGQFRKGVGVLLAGTRHAAIPAHVAGSHTVLPKGAWWPRFRRLRVVLGTPVSYEHEEDTREGWARVARDLEQRVRALAGEGAGDF